MQSASSSIVQAFTISSNIVDSQQQLVRQHLGRAWEDLPLAIAIGIFLCPFLAVSLSALTILAVSPSLLCASYTLDLQSCFRNHTLQNCSPDSQADISCRLLSVVLLPVSLLKEIGHQDVFVCIVLGVQL